MNEFNDNFHIVFMIYVLTRSTKTEKSGIFSKGGIQTYFKTFKIINRTLTF